MLLADVEGTLVQAIEAGPRRARCPGCESEVTAVIGEQVRWHWRHLERPDCDPWQESESDWHLGWKLRARDAGARLEVPMRDPTGRVVHRADIVLPNEIVLEVQHSSLLQSDIREREDFYARRGGIRWLFDHDSLRWLDDPRDRSRGAYGIVPPEVLAWFGGSMAGVWGQLMPKPVMLQAVGAHMAWDLPKGPLLGGSPARWVSRPIHVPAWGEWAVKVEDAPDIFVDDERALREAGGLVIPPAIPEPGTCPACGELHGARPRLDDRGRWMPCWEMTKAAWALIKDPAVPGSVKDWARGMVAPAMHPAAIPVPPD